MYSILYTCYLEDFPGCESDVGNWRHQDLRRGLALCPRRTQLKQRFKRRFLYFECRSKFTEILHHLKSSQLSKRGCLHLHLYEVTSPIYGFDNVDFVFEYSSSSLLGGSRYHQNVCWLILPVVASLVVPHLDPILDHRSSLLDPDQNLS